jgi:flagellar assembly factor FliW
MSEIGLSGAIVGFEECHAFVLKDSFGEASPFRTLISEDGSLIFVVVNPFQITEAYSFELDDSLLSRLGFNSSPMDEVAVLCIVRPDDEKLYANLRSPLIVNTKNGLFTQIILQDETYGVSVLFGLKETT